MAKSAVRRDVYPGLIACVLGDREGRPYVGTVRKLFPPIWRDSDVSLRVGIGKYLL